MLSPEPLARIPQFPVTGGTGVLAVAVSVPALLGVDMLPLVMDVRAFLGEPWRLLTSALPHGSVIHLVFNLMWLWIFGAYVENEFGRIRTAGLFAFLAAGSAAAEYAVFQGGIGLSGVGYGLFGFLWVLARRDPEHATAIDDSTVTLFVGWFFVCIALTIMNILPIANVAHASGAGLGAIAGLAASSKSGPRALGSAGAALAIVTTLAAASVARPLVNFSREPGADAAYLGYVALREDRNLDAVALLTEAVRMDPQEPKRWNNLSIAFQRTGDQAGAVFAATRVWQLAPDDPQFFPQASESEEVELEEVQSDEKDALAPDELPDQ